MTKRFGIDIDGTVTTPDALIPFINKEFNLQLTLDDIKQYEFTPVVPVSEVEFANWFSTNEPLMYRESPISEGAKDVLDEWDENHELFFISARKSELSEITKDWFKKEGILYKDIVLLGSHKKIEAAKKLNVDIFLEDKHDNAVEIHEELNIPVLLFDTPYNREPIPKGVIRVHSWAEAKQWVEQWLEQTGK
jgi:uncharacterized protein